MHVGPNFDILCQFDLNSPETQRDVWVYFETFRPLVAVMAPACTPFGPMANVNYWHNYEGWLKSYELAAPQGQCCGKIALYQDDNRRFFLNENPFQVVC